MTACDEPWTGSTRTIPPRCSPGSPSKLGAGSASPRARCMWIRPPFRVSGECVVEEADGTDPQTIAVTYGYSRDHRADLK